MVDEKNWFICLAIMFTSHCTKKFFIKDFFSKCDQILSFLRIWSHLMKKSLMKNFIFWAVFRVMDIIMSKMAHFL